MRVVFALLLAGTAACSEGYPSRNDGLSLHFQMTQQEVLDALNTIGSRSSLKHEWRYQVTEACELKVATHGKVFKQKAQIAELLGSDVELVKPEAGNSYSVVLSSKKAAPSDPTTVLADGTWSDASQIKWLLEYLPKFCEPVIG